MGIDVYLSWDKQTDDEKLEQITGFSIEHGYTGYLREAYHGGPYATAYLITEDWDSQPEDGFEIPATKLRERLPTAILASLYRYRNKAFEGQLAYTEADLLTRLTLMFAEVGAARDRQYTPTEEQVRTISKLISMRELPNYALSFVDFVELAERMEKRTGKPCKVYVSY